MKLGGEAQSLTKRRERWVPLLVFTKISRQPSLLKSANVAPPSLAPGIANPNEPAISENCECPAIERDKSSKKATSRMNSFKVVSHEYGNSGYLFQ